jgi:galactonate dehydratase
VKITSIEPIVVAVAGAHKGVALKGNWIFLQVRTDEGVTGLGEASHSGDDRLLLAAVSSLAARIVGRSPLDIHALWREMTRLDGGRIVGTALSAIEQALWDIRGQTLDVPVYDLFGGMVRDDIRVYANINRSLGDRSPEGFARHAAAAAAAGFTAIKIAPFDELRELARVRSGAGAAWRAGVARVAAVRRAIGAGVELAIDCHGRMEASEAIEVGKALADLDLLWYEEPVAARLTEDLADVRSAVGMTTASGETLFGVEGFAPFLVERVVDVLMPDVKHCGGLGECRAIAEAARVRGLLVAPHNPSGPLASAATAQVCAGMANFLILEHAWAEVPWRADLLDPPERIVGGCLQLSGLPGLGHRLDEAAVAAHRVT